MIICHSRKFIFIKTVKTAGTSLEMALSKYCGPGDVLTPLEPAEESQRRQVAGIGAQGHTLPLGKLSSRQLVRRLLLGKAPKTCTEHSTAWQIRNLVGQRVWDDYFTFAVVRHPFDRCVSRYYYTKHYENEHVREVRWDRDSFDQFLRYRTELINENWRMITQRDDVLVDFVVHYENLGADLAEVGRRIGLPGNLDDDLREINAKGGIRPADADVRQTLTDKHRRLIALLCEKEMSTFGYSAEVA